MAAKQIGLLFAKITANTTEFDTRMRKSGKVLDSFGAKFPTFSKAIAMSGAALGVAAIAAAGTLSVMTRKGLASGDALAKTADKLGLATEKLQALRLAGELAGVSQTTLDMALQRMTRRVAEAGKGTGEAVNALKELKLNAVDLARMSPDEQFDAISESMGDVANQGDKVRLAMKLFDSEGVAMVNMMKEGNAQFREAEALMEKYGLSLSRVDAAALERVNDQFVIMRTIGESASQKLAVGLAPALETINKLLLEGIGSFIRMDNVGSVLADVLIAGFYTAGQTINHTMMLVKSGEAGMLRWGAAISRLFPNAEDSIDTFTRAAEQAESELEDLMASPLMDVEKLLDWYDKIPMRMTKLTDTVGRTAGEMKNIWGITLQQMEQLVGGFGDKLTDTLADAVQTGKLNASELFNYIGMEIARLVIKMAVIRPLFGMIGGAISGFAPQTGAAFSGYMNPAPTPQATGGSAYAGQAYRVGENGPEIIVPKADSHIVANHKMGGGGDVYNIDARGADQAGIARLERILQERDRTEVRRVESIVQNAFARKPAFGMR